MNSKRISKMFKRLDLFGAGMSFTIDGNRNYNSILGALITLWIVIVVFLYGQSKFVVLKERADTSY